MHTIEDEVLSALNLRRDGVPIYVQIREQILALIAAGRLPAGARMPTMRQVAVALRVDLNTVRHAYDDLQNLGAVVLRRGLGSFVTERVGPADGAPATPDPVDPLDPLARRVLAEVREAGLDPLAVAERLVRLATSRKGDEP